MSFQIHDIDADIKSAYGLAVGDMNVNGKPDVIVGSMGEKMIAWYEGPTFKKHVVSTDHIGTICVAAHDLTGSGLPDIIAGSAAVTGRSSNTSTGSKRPRRTAIGRAT